MATETWKRVEELFEAALAQPAEGRAKFLEQACPYDSELRREVLSLLESSDQASSFLEGSPPVSPHPRPKLERGYKLSHFEILELIGEGATGSVYRAGDTTLKREVAVKVLSAEVARDPRSVMRFGAEARAASALNHPNIIQVYEVGHSDEIYWIASELASGQSLRQVIERRALSVGRAVEITVQIADGLAAAHAAGIIHRDLKPGNIIISSHGRAKILDFGLAKRREAISIDSESVTAALTAPGLVMGTPGYMAPEQITGKPADPRSDIFALGIILHEMLSGKRAFSGHSTVEVLNANLKDDPPNLPPSVPPVLARVTRRCLEKDPARRFQSAADVGFALLAVFDGSISATGNAARVDRISKRWIQLGIATAILLTTGTYWISTRVRARSPSPDYALRRLTADSGLTTDGAISPDGKVVAFASDRADPNNLDIWIKNIDSSGAPVRLTTDSADDYDPTFSSDGTQIAYRSEQNGGGIYEIPTLGGDPRLIVPQGRHPRFSPDGRFLMYWTGIGSRNSPSGGLGDTTKLFVQPLAGGPPTEIGAGCRYTQADAVWSPDSLHVLSKTSCHEQWMAWVWSVDGSLAGANKEISRYLQEPSPSSTEFQAPPYVFLEWLSNPSRVLMCSFGGHTASLVALPISGVRTGKQNAVTAGPGGLGGVPAIDWRGSRIAYVLDKTLTSGSNDPSPRTLWEIPTFGGLPRKLLDKNFYPTDWASDSRLLLGFDGCSNRPGIEILNLETKEQSHFLMDPTRSLYQAHFSNDGKWVTFNATAKDHSQLYVAPFRKAVVPQSEWVPITDADGWDDKPHFSYNDKLLFFTSHRDGHRCIWAQPLTSIMRPSGKAFAVYHSHRSRLSIENVGIIPLELGVAPRMIAFNQQDFTGNIWLLDSKN